MSAPAASASRSWSPKRYILLALAGTLVAAVIVVAVSAVLSPAAIEFSVVNATHAYLNEGYAGMYLNFTFAATNPGWRAGVNYRGFVVDLVRHPAGRPPIPFRPSYSKSNSVGTRLPFVQPARNTTDIMVPLFIGGDDWNKSMDVGGSEKTLNVSVQVRATVHFMVGMAYTRAYHIAVLCRLNCTLFSNDNNTVVSYDNPPAGCVAAGLIDPIDL